MSHVFPTSTSSLDSGRLHVCFTTNVPDRIDTCFWNVTSQASIICTAFNILIFLFPQHLGYKVSLLGIFFINDWQRRAQATMCSTKYTWLFCLIWIKWTTKKWRLNKPVSGITWWPLYQILPSSFEYLPKLSSNRLNLNIVTRSKHLPPSCCGHGL